METIVDKVESKGLDADIVVVGDAVVAPVGVSEVTMVVSSSLVTVKDPVSLVGSEVVLREL